jgi:rare lipoprotein A (peptidoglycan hydrolase)
MFKKEFLFIRKVRRSKLKQKYSVRSLVYITFFCCLCGYVVSSIGNSQAVHNSAKKAIHINETAAMEGDIKEDTQDHKLKKVVHGIASWYGEYFDGKPMANGKLFDMEKVSVAHRSLPLGTKVRVTNIDNGKHVFATVTDRGPYTKEHGRYSREIDLSKKAAENLGAVKEGLVPVRIEVFI